MNRQPEKHKNNKTISRAATLGQYAMVYATQHGLVWRHM